MLELRSIEKKLANFKLCVDELFQGITAVIGPSGSGKSSLLNIISGLLKPDRGSVILNGRDITPLPPEKRRIGYVFQDFALFPHMSVRENIEYGGKNLEVVDMLDIGHLLERKVTELSIGEKQRIALARALAGDPDILLLDEPMSSVDEFMRKRLTFELSAILRTLEIPVVYVTHSIREALIIGEEIAVIKDGRMIQKDRTEKVYEFPESRFVAEFTGFENVYNGRIVEKGKSLAIEWAEGIVYSEQSTFEVGDEVVFGIRPEHVMVIREGKSLGKNLEGNVFSGRIISRTKAGAIHEVLVKLEKEKVMVYIPDHAYHRLNLDERVEVSIGFKRNKVRIIERVSKS